VPKKKLTAISIASMKPRADRRYEVSDSGTALRVQVMPSGHKSFILRYQRPDGRSAKLTLGAFDPSAEMADDAVIGAPMTLAAARQLAAECLREKARGRDPAAMHKAAKAAKAKAQGECFAELARAYAAHLVQANRSGKKTARVVEAIAKVFGNRQLADISTSDCFDLIERCRKSGFPGQKVRREGASESRAKLAHSTISGFFSWTIRQRKMERSPIAGMQPPIGSPARERVLDDAEIRAFWLACEALSPWHCACLRILLLTGQRLREISELRVDELQGDAIALSGARTKNKRPHAVPLSGLAREVMDAVPRVEGSPFVFSSGSRPIGGWWRTKNALDARMRELGWSSEPWRIHDLRRTCATGLARIGTRLEVAEKVLNHASGTISGIAAVYNRHSYASECREALERWSVEVAKITGANVLRIDASRKARA
jgi:integrase